MEPEPRPILNAWGTPTMVIKPPQSGKPLQVPSAISKKMDEEHNAQFEKWCDDMLEQAHPEHAPPQTQAGPWLLLSQMRIMKTSPWPLGTTSNTFRGTQWGRRLIKCTQIDEFLADAYTITMLVKLMGDPELAEMLRSFLNNEMAINLETLHEAKLAPAGDGLEEDDPKSIFWLYTFRDYFEGNESKAVLLVVCKGNTILWVLYGGAGVSIVTKRYWEKMGQPQMEVVDLHVKLANGGLVKAFGLLRYLKFKILDHYVYHTFIVMDFRGKLGSFHMILGCPFMQEYQIVHNWSNNNVYLNLNDEHVQVTYD